MAKMYVVERKEHGVVVTVEPDEGPSYLLPHLVKHSPTGLEYGYGGSGPGDLARSIVGDVLGTDEPDEHLYMAFKWAWVSSRDQKALYHEITEHDVKTILDRAENLHGGLHG